MQRAISKRLQAALSAFFVAGVPAAAQVTNINGNTGAFTTSTGVAT